MEILDEKVNAHLPYYNTLKSSGVFSSKRFKLECSSSVVEELSTTEEEHSSLKGLEENTPELFSVL